jgi:Flp pilus assembly protein TadG
LDVIDAEVTYEFKDVAICSFNSWVIFVKTRSQSPGTFLSAKFHGIERLSRYGTAATEMAVAMPLLITLVFGSIEIANAVFLRQSLSMAAYEAAKVITRPGSNEVLARYRCDEVLAVRKVTAYTLSFSPTVTTATPRGTQVTVTLTATASNLSYGPVQFMAGKMMTSTVVMVRL